MYHLVRQKFGDSISLDLMQPASVGWGFRALHVFLINRPLSEILFEITIWWKKNNDAFSISFKYVTKILYLT